MISTFWQTFFVNPIFNALVVLFVIIGSLGLAIILLTIIIRGLLIPVMLPSMRNMKKQRELQPELDKIRKKYKNDKKKQAEAQMELFKKHGLNPASGCLTQIPMFIILIALFGAIRLFSTTENLMDLNDRLYFEAIKFTTETVDTSFLWLDLIKPDQYYILPIIAGALTFAVSKMTSKFTVQAQQVAKKTPDKSDDMAYNVQKQMLYIMPVMTVIISLNLPSGAVLYIITTSIFMLAQTYLTLGKGIKV
jgi:YidC/Oxa1 family membrane protein insertase